MKIKSILFVLPLIFGCSTFIKNDSNDIVFLDKNLEAAFSHKAETLKKERVKLKFSNAGIAHNCETYTLLSSESSIEESLDNMMKANEYVDCDGVRILDSNKGKVSDSVKHLMIGEYLSNHLDLRSFPSSLYQRTTDEAFTLSAMFSQKDLTLTKKSVHFFDGSHSFNVTVLAVAQLNDNDQPDLVVSVVDEILNATYKTYSIQVLQDISVF